MGVRFSSKSNIFELDSPVPPMPKRARTPLVTASAGAAVAAIGLAFLAVNIAG
jgi:hypothetical protein